MNKNSSESRQEHRADSSSETRPTPELSAVPSNEIEVIQGSARQTTALAIRRRQLLTEETAGISDLALHLAVQFTEHRTCFNEIGHGFCTGCEDIVIGGRWIDNEMDRAGIPREARGLPYPTHNAPAPTGSVEDSGA